MKRRLIVAALALGVVAGVAGTVDVASAGSPDIGISAKVKGQPFSDVAAFHLANGQKKTVKLKLETTTGEVETGALQQVFGAPSLDCAGFRFRYFTKSGTNITATVNSTEGHPVTVQPDTPKRFTMTVKRPAAADQRTYMLVRAIDQNGDTRDALIDVNNGFANCEA